MIPPRSPFGLIQEDLWSGRPESEWLILVVCMMLNCTSRKQVEKVLPDFHRHWPDPHAFLDASVEDVVSLCRPLGFANRRTANLKKMTELFITNDWKHASELPGVGQYAARSWEIFCRGELGNEPPNDHALVKYFVWATKRKETHDG